MFFLLLSLSGKCHADSFAMMAGYALAIGAIILKRSAFADNFTDNTRKKVNR